MTKSVGLVLIISLIFSFSSFQNLNTSKFRVKTVVIDAGHGGKDPGCVYSKIYEKNITLAIALDLGRIINENLPDVNVIYTRKTDEFIELHERANIANDSEANVFISIHVNANTSSAPYGTETYVMGIHKTAANLEVAKRENSVVELENNYLEKYDGFNPNSPEAYIIFSLFQNAYLEQSLSLAAKIEKDFKERVNRKSRGVKQAGFLVLYKTAMPSVLIETGYLSNSTERKFLTSKQGQVYIASAIFRAFRDFKKELEDVSN